MCALVGNYNYKKGDYVITNAKDQQLLIKSIDKVHCLFKYYVFSVWDKKRSAVASATATFTPHGTLCNRSVWRGS